MGDRTKANETGCVDAFLPQHVITLFNVHDLLPWIEWKDFVLIIATYNVKKKKKRKKCE